MATAAPPAPDENKPIITREASVRAHTIQLIPEVINCREDVELPMPQDCSLQPLATHFLFRDENKKREQLLQGVVLKHGGRHRGGCRLPSPSRTSWVC